MKDRRDRGLQPDLQAPGELAALIGIENLRRRTLEIPKPR